MQMYKDLTPAQREAEYQKVTAEFAALKEKGLKLEMSRSKP